MLDRWAPVSAALDRAAESGRTIEVWLRDDDAVSSTAALDRLAALARSRQLPVLLAVIPQRADWNLADFIAAEPLFTPTQHGFSHTNHARAGERACEMGGDRPLTSVLDDVMRGRDKLAALFGRRHAHILVPPWNRVDPALLPHLPDARFCALSTFADAHAGNRDLPVLNSTLDIIDWRNGRRCHAEAKLVQRLSDLIDRPEPIGILTHHLVHDDEAWQFLDHAFGWLASHGSVRLTSADAILARRAVAADVVSRPPEI
ncbi:polysaccharide deacetylase [Lichenifustis flavocetrariae]|uniref:Polysaccharide deacetylase n=1 Tax=Lichenifustis flavocetrariae TaxID=2949735 RepID=A0AA41Z0D5_9HYPH|nr:polysaccharide deacetylase [Lichenifustis flavocetrariae]MCW6510582.1 polysaccharide deacetylase [Lichenifustis flavocetrariae]